LNFKLKRINIIFSNKSDLDELQRFYLIGVFVIETDSVVRKNITI